MMTEQTLNTASNNLVAGIVLDKHISLYLNPSDSQKIFFLS